MFYFLIFIIGLFFGSFFTVLIDRIPRGESISKGRSHCEHCHKTLQWMDLIPVISYLSLKGRCRYCHTSLSLSYPILELLTGILFVQAAITISQGDYMFFLLEPFHFLYLLYTLFVVSCLFIVFFTDLRSGIIPFVIVLPAIFIVGLWVFFSEPFLLSSDLLSAFGASLFFFLCFALTKGRGMGFGDVVFAFLLGLLLGFPQTIIALYIAFLTGAGVSLILILGKKKRFKGSTIAFGPFLVFGLYCCYFWGDQFQAIMMKVLR